jgi:hypothetical protein
MSQANPMSKSRSEEAQSFLLRFWYEPSRLHAGHWRGEVGHWRGVLRDHLQDPADDSQPVVDPEEAFALVRSALERSVPDSDAGAPRERTGRSSTPDRYAVRGLRARLSRTFRCIFEGRS